MGTECSSILHPALCPWVPAPHVARSSLRIAHDSMRDTGEGLHDLIVFLPAHPLPCLPDSPALRGGILKSPLTATHAFLQHLVGRERPAQTSEADRTVAREARAT